VAGAIHLVRRFLGSLSPVPLAADDDAWATAHLGPGERRLWQRMPRADRKHSVGVARLVADRVGEGDRAVLAAALLHDVGKVDAELGTFGRAAATLVGQRRGVRWRSSTGLRGRIGRYLHHDVIGAALLEEAGAQALTVAWAREHHRPETAWTVPLDVGRVLRDADDD
jgi:hypothetical protein